MTRRRRIASTSRRSGRRTGSALLLLLLLLLAAVGSCQRGLLENKPQRAAGPNAVVVDKLWVQPDDGLEPFLDQLSSARTSLDVVVYLLTNQIVVEALISAQERGVAVRVMIEEDPFGGGAGSGDSLRALESAGVETEYGVSTFRYTHEKAVIIDGKRALVMTANLTKSAFTRNREYLALVTSPLEVAEIQAIFNADWDRRTYEPHVSSLVVSDVNSRQKLLELITSAQRSLEIEAEVMADKEIRRVLSETQKQGVRVRVVMSPPEPEETTYGGLVELSAAGVGVRLVSSPYIHAKSILVDRERAYIGSINFTATSMDQNRELGLITTTPAVIRQLGAAFDADWAKGKPFHKE